MRNVFLYNTYRVVGCESAAQASIFTVLTLYYYLVYMLLLKLKLMLMLYILI
jgi:hypothetical protein